MTRVAARVGAFASRPRAASAVGLLWGLGLILSVLGLQLWAGGSVPPADLAAIVGIAPFVAPLIFAVPLLTTGGWLFSHLSIEGTPVALAAGLIWVATPAGYWGVLAWLSWRVVSRRSRRALCVLGGALVPTAPFWLIATAWMASI